MQSRVRRFVVVGMQRSGTTLTLAQLTAHPQVAMFPEELHTALFSAAIVDRSPRGETRRSRTRSMRALFDDLAPPRAGVRARGLKTAIATVEHAARFVGCLATHGAGIDLVVVRRRDLVAQLGSALRAQRLGVWHRRAGEPPPVLQELVRIADAQLEEYVRKVVDCHRLLDHLAADRRTLQLDYEDDVVSGLDWARLCKFLGVDETVPTRALHKVSPPPEDFIADYEQLRARVPALLAACAQTPAPPPAFDPADSRLFLLRRAAMEWSRGRLHQALDDALAALDAPPDWGVERRAGGTEMIAELLERLGDAEIAARVGQRLAARWPDDPDVAALLAKIRRALGSA
jgi:hypothetical protein